MPGRTESTPDAVDRIVDVLVGTAADVRSVLAEHGFTGEGISSGERRHEAVVRADSLLEERLRTVEGVGSYASEDRVEPLDWGDGYAVTVDPLNGSSTLTSNDCMGTIVGIYDGDLPAPGRALVAVAYVLYGPLTTMVVASAGTVTEYIVEQGVATVRNADVVLGAEPTVFGFDGRVPDWPSAFTGYAREIERELKLRYCGAMVGDVNQVLMYGGLFASPALESRPEGTLRLQFEANPMAYVVETAGGRSSDGTRSVLDVEPTDLQQRTPAYLGNGELIDRLEAALE